jgi:hypothetical protein
VLDGLAGLAGLALAGNANGFDAEVFELSVDGGSPRWNRDHDPSRTGDPQAATLTNVDLLLQGEVV